MTRIPLAVIGAGYLGRHHARLLSGMDGVELVGVVDTDEERAHIVGREYGVDAYLSGSALPDRVAGVVVAVPTEVHVAVATPFLETGRAVLIEKPITRSLDEADGLVALAAKSGALLAVGHTERFNPAVEAAIPLIANPLFVEIDRLAQFPDRSLDIDVIFDLMIHDLDLLLAIVKSDVDQVEAIGLNVLTPHVDIANVRLRFVSGCVANVTASRISRERVRKVRFFAPHTYVSIDCAEQRVEAYGVTHAGGSPRVEGGAVDVRQGEPLAHELEDFVAAIRDGRQARVTGQAGRRALALATRVSQEIARVEAER